MNIGKLKATKPASGNYFVIYIEVGDVVNCVRDTVNTTTPHHNLPDSIMEELRDKINSLELIDLMTADHVEMLSDDDTFFDGRNYLPFTI